MRWVAEWANALTLFQQMIHELVAAHHPDLSDDVVTREAMKTLFPKRKFENLSNLFLRLFDFQISCLLSTVFNVDHFIMYITPRYFRLRVGWVGIYLRLLAFSSAAMGV